MMAKIADHARKLRIPVKRFDITFRNDSQLHHPIGWCSFHRAGLFVALALDESFRHLEANIVPELFGRRLEEVG